MNNNNFEDENLNLSGNTDDGAFSDSGFAVDEDVDLSSNDSDFLDLNSCFSDDDFAELESDDSSEDEGVYCLIL